MATPAHRRIIPSVHRLVRERQLQSLYCACHFELLTTDLFTKLYSSLPATSSERGAGTESYMGAVLNIEFSPADGVHVVLAVTDKGAILQYDPRTHSRVRVNDKAHEDAARINCVKFTDNYTFATCSDDTTIRLWDLRNPTQNRDKLRGHTSPVKNIEYDPTSKMLFSVARNDGVRQWDLDNVEEGEDNLVLKSKHGVLMKISPDGTKLFVATANSHSMCVVVDEFDGNNVHEIATNVDKMLKDNFRLSDLTIENLTIRDTNRPTIHSFNRRRNVCYRLVVSAAFQSNELIALRHIDFMNDKVCDEQTTLYDLRRRNEEYNLHLDKDKCRKNYLKFMNEVSTPQSIEKDIAFSHDGRVLASPYQNGVRLLAVDAQCTPADVYFDDRYHSHDKSLQSPKFEELGVCQQHVAPVLTCQFAHTDCLLATGCLGGQVKFQSIVSI